jgi:hypothetical protein
MKMLNGSLHISVAQDNLAVQTAVFDFDRKNGQGLRMGNAFRRVLGRLACGTLRSQTQVLS